MKNLFITILAVSLLSSCSSLNVSTETASVSPLTSTDPIKVNIDVEGNEKVSGTSKSVYLFNILRISGDNQFADDKFKGKSGSTKSAAHYKALKSSGADVIVNPQYEIKKTKGFLFLWSTIEAKVSGYKGKYSLKK